MTVQNPEFVTGPVPGLKYGYAGANSVDFTDSIAMEVIGVEDGNVYLTKEAAEYLMYSLWSAGVEMPEEAKAEIKSEVSA